MPSSSNHIYAVGELILVEHTDQLFDAKVVKLGDRVDGRDVFVHFVGWNKSKDIWSRLEHTRRITSYEGGAGSDEGRVQQETEETGQQSA